MRKRKGIGTRFEIDAEEERAVFVALHLFTVHGEREIDVGGARKDDKSFKCGVGGLGRTRHLELCQQEARIRLIGQILDQRVGGLLRVRFQRGNGIEHAAAEAGEPFRRDHLIGQLGRLRPALCRCAGLGGVLERVKRDFIRDDIVPPAQILRKGDIRVADGVRAFHRDEIGIPALHEFLRVGAAVDVALPVRLRVAARREALAVRPDCIGHQADLHGGIRFFDAVVCGLHGGFGRGTQVVLVADAVAVLRVILIGRAVLHDGKAVQHDGVDVVVADDLPEVGINQLDLLAVRVAGGNGGAFLIRQQHVVNHIDVKVHAFCLGYGIIEDVEGHFRLRHSAGAVKHLVPICRIKDDGVRIQVFGILERTVDGGHDLLIRHGGIRIIIHAGRQRDRHHAVGTVILDLLHGLRGGRLNDHHRFLRIPRFGGRNGQPGFLLTAAGFLKDIETGQPGGDGRIGADPSDHDGQRHTKYQKCQSFVQEQSFHPVWRSFRFRILCCLLCQVRMSSRLLHSSATPDSTSEDGVNRELYV